MTEILQHPWVTNTSLRNRSHSAPVGLLTSRSAMGTGVEDNEPEEDVNTCEEESGHCITSVPTTTTTDDSEELGDTSEDVNDDEGEIARKGKSPVVVGSEEREACQNGAAQEPSTPSSEVKLCLPYLASTHDPSTPCND